MKKQLMLTVFVTTVLAGCGTINQLNDDYKLRMLNRAKTSCINYGFKQSTDSFAHCVQTEINEAKKRAAIEDAAKAVKHQ